MVAEGRGGFFHGRCGHLPGTSSPVGQVPWNLTQHGCQDHKAPDLQEPGGVPLVVVAISIRWQTWGKGLALKRAVTISLEK